MNYIWTICTLALIYSCKSGDEIHLKNRSRNERYLPLGATTQYLQNQPSNKLRDVWEFATRYNLDTFNIACYNYGASDNIYNLQTERPPSPYNVQPPKNEEAQTKKNDLKKLDAESIFIIGKTKGGDCIIAADQNNNNLIGDDPIQFFPQWFHGPRSIDSESLPIIKLRNLETIYNAKKRLFSSDVLIKPYRKDSINISGDTSLLALGVHLSFIEYKEGHFRRKGTKYKVAVRSLSGVHGFDKTNTRITIAKRNEPYPFLQKRMVSDLYALGETININGEGVIVDSVADDGSVIFIKTAITNQNEKMMANFVIEDMVNKNNYDFDSLFSTNDYVLIDFWGSWCGPCIQSLPKLKDLNKQLEGKRVGFLGVLYDDSTKIEKINSIIMDHNINWPQMVGIRDYANPIFEKNRITAYPTYMIVDNKRNIVYRDAGVSGLDRVKDYLILKLHL